MRTGLKKAQLHTRNARLLAQWEREIAEDSPRTQAYRHLFEETRERMAAEEAAKEEAR